MDICGLVSVMDLPREIKQFLFSLGDVGDSARVYYLDEKRVYYLLPDFVLRDVVTFEREAPSCLEFQIFDENFSCECE